MTSADGLRQTRQGYDTVAAAYARLLPGLDVETGLDIAMIDDFAARCAAAGLGPVADVGCGTGRITAHLAGHGLDVFGIDLSPGMVDVARRLHPHLPFDVGSMEGWQTPDATLGGVLAWYSLIHTPPEGLPAVVDTFARALQPGGWLLTAFQAGEGQRVDRTRAYGHEVRMTNYRHSPAHVGAVLRQGGFVVRAELHRQAEAAERSAQSVLLARR